MHSGMGGMPGGMFGSMGELVTMLLMHCSARAAWNVRLGEYLHSPSLLILCQERRFAMSS